MHPPPQAIAELTERVWHSLFNLSLTPARREFPETHGEVFTGCVHVTGDWEGVLAIRCLRETAEQASSTLFQNSRSSSQALVDTLAEVANLIANSMKVLMPPRPGGPPSISVPIVVGLEDYVSCFPEEQIDLRIGFECGGEPVEVVLIRKAE